MVESDQSSAASQNKLKPSSAPYPFGHDDLGCLRNATFILLILRFQQIDRRCPESRQFAVQP